MMENLEGILKLADNELEAMNKYGKFKSREDVDTVYKLIDIVKDVYCIWQYEDEMEEGEDGESYEGGSYRGSYERGGNRGGRGGSSNRSYRGSYNMAYEGGSYARGRGRGRNARRDSMGRYSREGSYDGGKEEYIETLREAMENAPDEQSKQSIRRMIQQMEM